MQFFKLIEKTIVRLNMAIMVFSLAAMIILGFVQVILRNFFHSGFDWADITVRNLVLWAGFSGAVIATANGRHVAIGVLVRFIPERAKKITHVLISLFASAICLFLAYASVKFVLTEKEMGGVLVHDFPIWISELIIPATFVFLTCQFLMHTFMPPVEHEGEGI